MATIGPFLRAYSGRITFLGQNKVKLHSFSYIGVTDNPKPSYFTGYFSLPSAIISTPSDKGWAIVHGVASFFRHGEDPFIKKMENLVGAKILPSRTLGSKLPDATEVPDISMVGVSYSGSQGGFAYKTSPLINACQDETTSLDGTSYKCVGLLATNNPEALFDSLSPVVISVSGRVSHSGTISVKLLVIERV